MTLRFGLIGLGKHGANAVAPVFSRPECTGGTLESVCDASRGALDSFALAVKHRYLDYRDLLASDTVDAVYVAVGMDRHREIVLEAARAKKHIIVEKPMASTPEECRQMIDAAERAGVILAVNFEGRFGEENAVLRRWIADGRFGKLEALHFTNLWDGHKSFGPVKERRARLMELAGALDCGIHKLDQARFLAGGGWVDLYARGAWMGEEFTPPTHIGIVGQLEGGVLVTVNASLSWAAHIEPRPMINTIEIAGTDGVAILKSTYDFQTSALELYSKTLTESHTIGSAGHTSDIVHVVNEFARVVAQGRHGDSILACGEDGYWAQWATNRANRQSIEARIRR
jgi:predicted dehydrogenase